MRQSARDSERRRSAGAAAGNALGCAATAAGAIGHSDDIGNIEAAAGLLEGNVAAGAVSAAQPRGGADAGVGTAAKAADVEHDIIGIENAARRNRNDSSGAVATDIRVGSKALKRIGRAAAHAGRREAHRRTVQRRSCGECGIDITARAAARYIGADAAAAVGCGNQLLVGVEQGTAGQQGGHIAACSRPTDAKIAQTVATGPARSDDQRSDLRIAGRAGHAEARIAAGAVATCAGQRRIGRA